VSKEAAYRAYLDKVHAALNGGDASDGERLAKAVSALVRAERDVAEYLRDVSAAADYDDPDAIRAELLRRITRFSEPQRTDGVPEGFAECSGEGASG
jgi:hypothetical protein